MLENFFAVALSDIHFSHTPPIARAREKSWYGAMEHTWQQVLDIAGPLPLFIAGDIFHVWNPPPELINFVIRLFKKKKGMGIYAIPGQHDMPFHRSGDIHKSAYGTLMRAGVMQDVSNEIVSIEIEDLEDTYSCYLYGYEWERTIETSGRKKGRKNNEAHVALCHRYVWQGTHGHEKAKDEEHASHLAKISCSYDFMIFGDNHSGFTNKAYSLINCGGLMRRRMDEVDRVPCVYKLGMDHSIHKVPLDVKSEIIEKAETIEDPHFDSVLINRLTDTLKGGLANINDSLDFKAVLNRICEDRDIAKKVKEIIVRAME